MGDGGQWLSINLFKIIFLYPDCQRVRIWTQLLLTLCWLRLFSGIKAMQWYNCAGNSAPNHEPFFFSYRTAISVSFLFSFVLSLNSLDNFARDLSFIVDMESCLKLLLLGCSGCLPASPILRCNIFLLQQTLFKTRPKNWRCAKWTLLLPQWLQKPAKVSCELDLERTSPNSIPPVMWV